MKKIDIMKFVMSFLVITIHVFVATGYTSCPAGFYIVNTICRLAVPFFFLCSGYFCNVKSLKTIKRLTILYIMWSLIYSVIVKFDIVSFLFKGYVYHLWYMVYSIYGLLLIHFLTKKIDIRYIVGIFFALYLPLYISNRLCGLTQFFFAVCLLSLGQYMKYKIALNKKTSIIILLLSIIGLVIEVNLIDTDVATYIFLIPGVFALFDLLQDSKNDGAISLRKYSTLIYFNHVFVMSAILLISNNPWVSLLLTSVVSLIISILIVKLSNIKCCKFLKILY